MAVCKTERYLTPEFNKFQTTCTRRLQVRKLHHTPNTPLTVHNQSRIQLPVARKIIHCAPIASPAGGKDGARGGPEDSSGLKVPYCRVKP